MADTYTGKQKKVAEKMTAKTNRADKKEERFYLYMYRPFKLMVGVLCNDFIPRQGSCDWYYLTRFETLVYLITGKLPHERKPNDS